MAEPQWGSLQFREQIQFFLGKLDLPTATWRDIWQDAHDRAFVVAGAMKADLISDLRMAVQKGIDQGTTLEEFRRDFEAIVKAHGWTGWTGEGTKAGRAWRTRVIYETNLRTSYAAGRWAQLKAAGFPYLRYKHNDNVMVPRPAHLALDGRIFRADDPFWQRAAPPNGWGCKCWIEGVSEREMRRSGKLGPDTPPADWTADEGWNYAPGASVADEVSRIASGKVAGLAMREAGAALAKAHVAELLAAELFARFVAGGLGGEYPVAVLDAKLRQALNTEQPVVMLSRVTVDEHRHHPEIGAADYALAQRIVDEGEIFEQAPGRLVVLWRHGGKLYRAALKRTEAGDKNYWLTLFLTTDELAAVQVRGKFARIH